jgi:predicted negative regulator of RcsB-dependent stress response
VLDYSWQLLSAGERNAFAALSVFRAGFELDAAEDVARISMSMLFTLVDKSFLRRTPAGRYEMHDLVRRYGEEKLDAIEDEDYSPNTVHARMARYFLQYAAQYGKDYARLEPEWPNFLAAMRAAHERYEWSTVTQLAQALTDAWFTRARFSDAREGLAMASQAALAEDSITELARFSLDLGRAAMEQDDYAEARKFVLASLQLSRQADDPSGIADATLEHARIEIEQSNHDLARELFQTSFEAFSSRHDDRGAAHALVGLARLCWRNDDVRQARAMAEQALTIQQRIQDHRACIDSLRLLARIAADEGTTDEANSYCEHALALCEENSDSFGGAVTMLTWAQVLSRSSDARQALRLLEKCGALFRHWGNFKYYAHTLFQMSIVKLQQRDYQGALAAAVPCVDLYSTFGEKWSLTRLYSLIGDIHSALNHSDEARDAWSEGLRIAVEQHDPQAAYLRQRLGL